MEVVGSSGYNWLITNSYKLYRNFHSSLDFSPSYNFSLINPPKARADESVIRFSGGQSSDSGNTGIIYFPYLNRTFFPADTTYSYTIEGSYIELRKLEKISKNDLFCDGGSKIIGYEESGNSLIRGRTYWVAFAPIYDSYQIGELERLEDINNDYDTVGNLNV